MLHVEGLTAGYAQVVVLREVSFTVPAGGVVIVEGANGTGKTTLVHAIAGLLARCDGAIHHGGVALHGLPAHWVARAGVALVPQGRRVFASLSVAEHLRIGRRRPGPWTTERILERLPALRPLLRRDARHLSGGEQQLLAIARALSTNPSLLLLDEPTEGLAPAMAATVSELITSVAEQGVTVLRTAADTTGAIGLSIREAP